MGGGQRQRCGSGRVPRPAGSCLRCNPPPHALQHRFPQGLCPGHAPATAGGGGPQARPAAPSPDRRDPGHLCPPDRGSARAGSLQARPEPERLSAAEAVLSAWPGPVSFGGDRAFYLPQLDRIQLPERASFHSPGAFYATWAHEQVQSTGHASRLSAISVVPLERPVMPERSLLPS